MMVYTNRGGRKVAERRKVLGVQDHPIDGPDTKSTKLEADQLEEQRSGSATKVAVAQNGSTGHSKKKEPKLEKFNHFEKTK